MAIDRYRAAFAREAVHRLAEQDLCRVHSLTLDGKVIASLIVFVEAGVAYTWKTAYDEAYAAYLAGHAADDRGDQAASRRSQHRDDRFLRRARPSGDDAAVDRAPADGHAGDRPDARRRPLTRQAASQLHLYRETRNMARLLRNRIWAQLSRR